MPFPRVTGENLAGQRLTLPGDLAGDRNLLFIAFQRWQQADVDTWTALAAELQRGHPGCGFYELPTISPGNPLMRWFINNGMRSGIKDQESRRRTITLFLEKGAFRRGLNLPDEERIYVLLVGREGTIYWRAEGRLDAEKEHSLRAAIDEWERDESQRR